MAHIEYVSAEDADEKLRRLRDGLSDDDGRVDNIVWIHGVNPPAIRHHLQLYEHAMRGPSPLSEAQREMIAVAVSAANGCFY